MLVYHRTDHSEAILRDGFRDGEDTYGTAHEYRGVWVSDEPLTWQEGAEGKAVLRLDIPETLFVEYEWVEEAKPYREALIPAAELNRYRSSMKLESSDSD
jgi:hypothetical protein